MSDFFFNDMLWTTLKKQNIFFYLDFEFLMDTVSVTISSDVHDKLNRALFNEIKITFNYKKSEGSVSFKSIYLF